MLASKLLLSSGSLIRAWQGLRLLLLLLLSGLAGVL
jgi:hypothetical protein